MSRPKHSWMIINPRPWLFISFCVHDFLCICYKLLLLLCCLSNDSLIPKGISSCITPVSFSILQTDIYIYKWSIYLYVWFISHTIISLILEICYVATTDLEPLIFLNVIIDTTVQGVRDQRRVDSWLFTCQLSMDVDFSWLDFDWLHHGHHSLISSICVSMHPFLY